MSWSELFRSTAALSRPASIALSRPLVTLEDIEAALRAMGNDPGKAQNDGAARVYVGPEERILQGGWLASTFAASGGGLPGWLDAQFGGKSSFCVLLNGLERWSEPLAHRVAALLRPVFDDFSFATSNLELGLVVGRYRFTPFGVHADASGECTLHFNLGPGVKTFYITDPKSFRRVAGDLPVHADCDELLPHMQRYDVAPRGDRGFLLPHGSFHVGSSEELSVSLTISLKQESATELAEAATRTLAGALTVPSTQAFAAPPRAMQSLRARLSTRSAEPARAVSEHIAHALEARTLAGESNGGLRTRPVRWPDLDGKDASGAVRGYPYFPIRTRRDGDRLEVFARGEEFSLRAQGAVAERLTRVFGELSDGIPRDRRQLHEAFSGALSAAAVDRIVELLLQMRALDPAAEAAAPGPEITGVQAALPPGEDGP